MTDTATLDDGFPGFALRIDHPLALGPITDRRLQFFYDDQDFDGLKLQTFALGAQALARTCGQWAGSLGVGIGVATGLVRSKSFHDDAWHLIGELSAGFSLSLGRIVIEYEWFERATTSAELDERDAAPCTRGHRLNFVIRL